MTGRDRMPGGIDTSTPNVARIYDYLLGGKDNFAADRAAAERLIDAIPDVAAIARDNRSFVARVVRYMTTAGGIRQFLDLGSGLPTQANVHELAQAVAPDARVIYVDNDPVVALHGQALLASGGQAGMVLGDLRDPAAVLQHPAVACLLDLSQPVAVLCTSTLHFVADQSGPHKIIAAYRGPHGTGQLPCHHPRHLRGRSLGRRRQGNGRFPQGVVPAAHPAAARGRAVLRWLRARRARPHLDHRMAARPANRAHRTAVGVEQLGYPGAGGDQHGDYLFLRTGILRNWASAGRWRRPGRGMSITRELVQSAVIPDQLSEIRAVISDNSWAALCLMVDFVAAERPEHPRA